MNTATQLAAVAVLTLSGFGLYMVADGGPSAAPAAPGAVTDLDQAEVVAAVTGSSSGFLVRDEGVVSFDDPKDKLTQGLRFQSPWTLSDPRLSGETWSVHDYLDFGPVFGGSGGMVVSGSMGIDSNEGSWRGTFHGYARPGEYEDVHYLVEFAGSGGYAGLSAMLMLIDQGSRWDIQGIIYPGQPLPYPEAD